MKNSWKLNFCENFCWNRKKFPNAKSCSKVAEHNRKRPIVVRKKKKIIFILGT